MTGFASRQQASGCHTWIWEIRSLNARGFDARLRLPDWMESSDPLIRRELAKTIRRGSVTVTARLRDCAVDMTERLDMDALERKISQIAEIEAIALKHGVQLARTSAAEILPLRGVLISGEDGNLEVLRDAMLEDLRDLIAELDKGRCDEGQALERILTGQFDRIDGLLDSAVGMVDACGQQISENLRDKIEELLAPGDALDDARLEQEVALIAAKADVTEEIDRLRAHVRSAYDLIGSDDAVGRRLDFLAQEMNREANTLCAKSHSFELSRLGLDLKATINQLREQLQNVE
ncbi:MAG: YicC family protein [Rhodobacter sp.]|nr:YicC family protein [Rhodobacter sp.]MCY4240122.1 YicC family protein [Rhodobacter sp.]